MEDSLCATHTDDPRCVPRTTLVSHLLIQSLKGTAPATQCAALCTDSNTATTAQARGNAVPNTASNGNNYQVAGDLECPFCEFVVEALRESLADGATQQEVLQEARATCNELPASFAVPCVDYVDEKGARLVLYGTLMHG